jgi:phosphoglucosamine mutase
MALKYFGTDGVRGVFGEKLTLDLVGQIGRAVVASDCNKVVIGHDTRESCAQIIQVLKDVFISSNVSVVDVGTVPTNAISFFVREYKCDFGIMITASHNPPEHNGIKLFDNMGRKLDGEALEKIDGFIESCGKSPVTTPVALWADYLVSKFSATFKGKKLPRVALDFANGSGQGTAVNVLKKLGFALDIYNTETDGKNVNANCGALHPEFLQKRMSDARSASGQGLTPANDVGFAFDGDADRCIVLDGNGIPIEGEKTLAALGLYLKAKKIVSTVVFNGGVEKYLVSKGIEFVRTPVGGRHVIAELRKSNATDMVIGGEANGHFMFPHVTRDKDILVDDGLVTALMVLEMLVGSRKSIYDLCSEIPMWANANYTVTHDIHEGEFWIDGCRVLNRKSGTEALTRIYVEGEDPKKVEAVAQSFLK